MNLPCITYPQPSKCPWKRQYQLQTYQSHTSGQPSQPCTDTDEKRQQSPSSEHAEQDADANQDDEHPAKDVAREHTPIHSDQLLTVLLPADDVIIPTEKVGCILVTSHLQQFLEDYLPS